MIYFHKVLPLVFSPLFLVLTLIILGIYFRLMKISLFGIIILICLSLPIVSNNLIGFLEKDYFLKDISNIEEADAIVVLSGMTFPIKKKNNEITYEFRDSVDRILAGINLYKKNKAPFLILTRGQVPWVIGLPEGEVLKDFAIHSGVREKDIILTDNAQNTEEEAREVKKILNDKNKIIIVTSAFHMPRALKVFNAFEINAMPFAVDFRRITDKLSILDFIPSASSFNDTSFVVREMIGRFYYSLKY